MKKSILLAGLMLTSTLLFQGCKKKSINKIRDTNQSTPLVKNELGKVVLGDKLENPYTVANMKVAYTNLKGKSSTSPIFTTDLYVRFKPKNIEEFKQLEQSGLDLWDTPFDYEIDEFGEFYHDPAIPENQLTYYYAVVKPDFIFNENIEYSVLADLFLPQSIEESKNMNIDLDRLENEALTITDNLENEPTAKMATKYHPQGYIKVERKMTINGVQQLADVPVKHVKVRSKRWFKIGSDETDDQGHFYIDKKYKKNVTIKLVFKNQNCRIRGIRGYNVTQIFNVVKDKIGEFDGQDIENIDYTIPSVPSSLDNSSKDLRIWMAANAVNAIRDFDLYCQQENIGRPQQKLNIWLTSEITSDASAPMLKQNVNNSPISALLSIYLVASGNPQFAVIQQILEQYPPDITYAYDGFERTDLFDQTMFHELGHAIHYGRVGNTFWNSYISHIVLNLGYGDGNDPFSNSVALAESWAEFIGNACAQNKYQTFPDISLNNFNSYAQWEDFNPGHGDWLHEGVMYDMIDVGESNPNIIDNVDAYTVKDCYEAMDPDILSLYEFCARALGETNSLQSSEVIDLYDSYGIQQ